MPDYAERPEWQGSIEASKDFIWTNGLRFLRHNQLSAIENLQKAVAAGKDRFLFELATWIGKRIRSFLRGLVLFGLPFGIMPFKSIQPWDPELQTGCFF